MHPTYEEMGTKTETALPALQLSRGLPKVSEAVYGQLSLDFLGNEEGFQIIQHFAQRTRDERADLTKNLEDVIGAYAVLGVNQRDYSDLNQGIGYNEQLSAVRQKANSAAGATLLGLRQAFNAGVRTMYDHTGQYYDQLATYCRERTGASALTVLGCPIKFSSGYITTRGGRKEVVFSSTDARDQLNRTRKKDRFGRQAEGVARLATVAEIVSLTMALSVIAEN